MMRVDVTDARAETRSLARCHDRVSLDGPSALWASVHDEGFISQGLQREGGVAAPLGLGKHVAGGKRRDDCFVVQTVDDNPFRIRERCLDKSDIDLVIAQTFAEFVGEVLRKRYGHQRKSRSKLANDSLQQWMKPSAARVADRYTTKLAARRAPSRIDRVVEVGEHCAGVVKKRAASIGQLHAPRLTPE